MPPKSVHSAQREPGSCSWAGVAADSLVAVTHNLAVADRNRAAVVHMPEVVDHSQAAAAHMVNSSLRVGSHRTVGVGSLGADSPVVGSCSLAEDSSRRAMTGNQYPKVVGSCRLAEGN